MESKKRLLSLGSRLLFSFLSIIIAGLIVLSIIVYMNTGSIINSMARLDLDNICQGIYNTVKMTYQLGPDKVHDKFEPS